MKKYLLSLAALVAAASASADTECLELTFERTGTTVESVTVNTNLEGVTATLVSTSHNFMSTGNDVTNAILCPDVNGKDNPTIEFNLSIIGLPTDWQFNTVGLHIHGLNSQKQHQAHDDNKPRQWNVEVDIDDSEVGSLDDIDIAAGITGAHKEWDIAVNEAISTSESTSLKLIITKGSQNNGCFFGLEEISIGYDYSAEVDAYRSAQLVGIEHCPGVFDQERVNYVKNVPVNTYKTMNKEEAKSAIDNAIELVYQGLDGKTFTFHNEIQPNGASTPHYLSGNGDTKVNTVTDKMDNNVEWTLNHVSGNTFTIQQGNKFITSADAHTTSGGSRTVPFEETESPKNFAIEPYSDTSFAENTVALRNNDLVDPYPEATNVEQNIIDGSRVYIQCDGDNNYQCWYWHNNVNHNSAKKGAWVMTAIEPGSTTSITEIESAKVADTAIYDLQGRRVANPAKGIFIQNGRKFIVK